MTRMLPRTPTTKLRTGIAGFDEITGGGLPLGRTTLLLGGPGSGKTVMALQTLVGGAHFEKEAGIFVAFEEPARHIIANAATFGWDLPGLSKRKLFFLNAHLSPDVVRAGEFDLAGMLAILEAKAEEIHAKRIVFDGIDMLLALLDNPVAERRELYRIRDWLMRTGLTAIITQKADGLGDGTRYSFLQFMADCVVALRQRVVAGSAFRTLRVVKFRGSDFARDEFPILLDGDGLQVMSRGPREFRYRVSNERVSSGLPGLDHMLHGGYFRGSNILVSGAPGTAKSILAGLFAAAACERGERTLYVARDEGASQIVRNLRSVGIRLSPHMKSGLLKVYATRTRGPNFEEQFGDLRAMVREINPRCLVMDPLPAPSAKLVHLASADASQPFLDFLKVEGITVVHTSGSEGPAPDESTTAGISTLADSWIHLSTVVQNGERRRALTIVKSRGMAHSNRVRELTLSGDGVSLTGVFVLQGEAQSGVPRLQVIPSEMQERRDSPTDRRRAP